MGEQRRGRGRLIAGVIIPVVGVAGSIGLWLAAAQRLDSAVGGLAQAPVGCDTVLDFDDAGEYFVFVQTRGELDDDVRGDCVAPHAVDRNSDAIPEVTVTVTDPNGNDVEFTADDGVDFDTDTAAGISIGRIAVEEEGDHLIRVESDDDDFYIAVGRDPNSGVTAMRVGAIVLALAALVIGLALIVTGRRRPDPAPAATSPWAPEPSWPTSPPGFPAPPPTTGVTGVVGPPSAPPIVRPTTALPVPPNPSPEPARWGPPAPGGS